MAPNPLLKELPRERWPDHPNMQGLAAFWIQRHDGFRDLGEHMDKLVGEFMEDRLSAPDFLNYLIRPLNDYLSNLHGHHSLEDQHYFPAFKRAEPALANDFARLDGDHVGIHETMVKIVEGWKGFAAAEEANNQVSAAAVREMASTVQGFIKNVNAHLDDEEDIVIPLMLKHGY